MNVIPYQEKYKKDFIQFNTDWIVDNFGCLEEEDLDTFNHIEESLQKGAMIYFAIENENVLAACMTKPLDDCGTWELCKLSSNKHLPHKGAGSAVHIYEKYGFHEIKLDDYEYVRGDIAFEYMVPRRGCV